MATLTLTLTDIGSGEIDVMIETSESIDLNTPAMLLMGSVLRYMKQISDYEATEQQARIH